MKNILKFFKSYKNLVLKSKVNAGLLVFFAVAGVAELFTNLRGGIIFLTFVLAVYMYFVEYWKDKNKP